MGWNRQKVGVRQTVSSTHKKPKKTGQTGSGQPAASRVYGSQVKKSPHHKVKGHIPDKYTKDK